MTELIGLYDRCLEEEAVHTLIALAAFNLDFLCIHPFRDGNGRISRLLLLLQCYHLGYDVGRYIGIERLIEKNEERYYKTLEQSSAGWHERKHDPLPHINYLLFIIKSAYKEFENRLGQIKSPRGAKTQMIEAAIVKFWGSFSLGQIESACPGVSRDMIRRTLRNLQQQGIIECLGRGLGAEWNTGSRSGVSRTEAAGRQACSHSCVEQFAPQNLITTGRIFLLKQDSSPMSVSVNGGLPASEMTFSLDPFSTMSLELTSEGPTVSEWCLIEVDDFEFGSSWGMMDGVDMIRGRRIMANVIYTYENGNTLSMVATHPNMYEMGYYSRSLLPVQNQNELHTGFAMVNISSQDATVELRLWDRYGQLNSMQTVSLHAGQQIAQYVHNRFEGLPDGFRGFLEFTTDNEGIVAMGLLDEQGMLISVPMRHYGEISRMMH